MKRNLKWLAIVLAVSLLGFATALLLRPCDRITLESWQKIRIGMTEDEVVEILGSPGISPEEFFLQYNRLGQPPLETEARMEEPEGKGGVGDRSKFWSGRRGFIVIELDQDKHVRWKGFRGGRWINGGILDRLRDWLGW
jgi:hypothetical protein